ILSEEPTYMMPPPESNLELTTVEKAMLLRWIEQGAVYKKHWSFLAPVAAEIPNLKEDPWVKDEIDFFIKKSMLKQGLAPNSEADREVLLRRLALDLTGLPPSAHNLNIYAADTGDIAIEKVIDQLLSSNHFGERMALEWMDAARYADSHGYQDDGMRNTWPWRDWVIEAFNRNLPYDTFLLWQLAGDLLPSPTEEQILATCFNRNHPQSQEGGVVDEEYRVEYVADRTNTLGKAILGLTVECARCHDHKYDPITQKDYYSLFAYFNNNNDAGVVPYNGEASPTIILPPPGVRKVIDSLRYEIHEMEGAMQASEAYISDFKKWYNKEHERLEEHLPDHNQLVGEFHFDEEFKIDASDINLEDKPNKRTGANKSYTIAYYNHQKKQLDAALWGHMDDKPILEEGRNGKAVLFQGDAGIRFNRELDFDRDQPFAVSLWVKFLKEGEEGPVFGKTNGDFEGYRGWLCKLNSDGTLSFQFNHVWPDNCIDFQTTEPVRINEWTHIVLSYDGSSKAAGIKFYLDGKIPEHRLHQDNLKKSLLHGVNKSNWSNQPFLLGMELRKSIEHLLVDDLKIYRRPLSRIEVQQLFDADLHPELQEKDWFEYYLLSGKNALFNKRSQDLQKIRQRENLLVTDQPEVMVMQEKKYARKTYILDRGAYDAPSEEVAAGVPEVFIEDTDSVGTDRLSLAQWVISRDNPLTARVVVNRLWRMCFGRGLVATQEDFGAQGSLPTHPELLDYLALEFMEMGWDVKKMLKKIMLSATYRQSSGTNGEQLVKDPENHFYSRYPTHRLGGEIIRDQVLSASGLLVPKIGGPSVYPYQPDGIWEALATRNAISYNQQSGDSLYRRSLYTIWKRSSPPPAMLNFDAPDRYYCVVRRQQTSTPLQSLVLMNDPQFVEAARVLAEKMVNAPTLEESLHYAYQQLFGRKPNQDESANLTKLYYHAYDHFQAEKSEAEKLLSVGEFPLTSDLDKEKLAAQTIVASTLINYDEFVTKR
ncbi:MAG: DUF1553 domain-containing protein, partial [Saprospiraceae bacterium]|nr:DUF1553 domain-containing protein [Saprospiraceae bacterium]